MRGPSQLSERQLALILLLAAVLVAYLAPLFLGSTFAARDHLLLTLPSRAFVADNLALGNLPEWWSGVGLGINAAGNPQHGLTYPPTWLVAVLPTLWAADLLIVLHVAFFGFGVARLSTRLGAAPMPAAIAGAAAMLSGYVTSMTVMGVPLMTLAWMPWAVLAADHVASAGSRRRRAVASAVFAMAFGLLIMSGDPAGVVTATVACILWALVRSDSRLATLAWLALGGLGAAVLSAATWMPALAVLAESNRAGGAAASGWSMHPLRILEWMSSGLFGLAADPRTDLGRAWASSAPEAKMGSGWALSLHLGLPVLIAIAMGASGARRRKLLLAGAGLFVVLALGHYTPLYAGYRWLMWPERLIRYPERHLAGALVMALPLAGVGLSRLLDGKVAVRWSIISLALAVVPSAALVIAALGWPPALPPSFDVDAAWPLVWQGLALAAVTTALMAGLVYTARRPQRRRHLPWLAAVILVVPLVRNVWQTLPLVSRAAVARVPELLAPLATTAPSQPAPRVYRHRSALPRPPADEDMAVALHRSGVANTGTRFGIDYVPGYDPSISRRARRVWEAGARRGLQLLALYGVEHLVVPDHQRDPRMRVVARGDGLALLGVDSPRSRGFVSHRWSKARELGELFGAGFDPHRVRLEEEVEPSLDGAELSPCAVSYPDADSVVMDCHSNEAGYAALLDAWAPGWTATVDGEERPILSADHVVRAVAVPAGSHHIAMKFRAPGLRAGAVVAGLGWAGLVLGLLLGRRRRS